MRKRFLTIFLYYAPIFLLFSGFFQTTSGLNQKGNKEYQEKHYDTALDSYRKAQVKNPEDPDVRYNLGTTLYQLDQFQDAERELQSALSSTKTKELKASAIQLNVTSSSAGRLSWMENPLPVFRATA